MKIHITQRTYRTTSIHYNDVIMGTIASQITSVSIVYLTVSMGTDQVKHQSSASLAFARGIHRGPVNAPHKWPLTRKMFPFDDVIIKKTMLERCRQVGNPLVPLLLAGSSFQRDDALRMSIISHAVYVELNHFSKSFQLNYFITYAYGKKIIDISNFNASIHFYLPWL